MARLRWLLAGLVGLVSLGLLPGVASAAGCSNEALRTGYSASLPDCRAYEQVSPVDKNGGGVGPFLRRLPSSVDGNRVAYFSSQPFAGVQGAADLTLSYVASRGAGGWSTHGLLPREAASNTFVFGAEVEAFSSDLSSYVLHIGGGRVNGGLSGQDDPPLVPGEPPNTQNLFVRSTETGTAQLVDVTPPGVASPDPSAATLFVGATPDLSHVFFVEDAPLTSNAPAGHEDLYEWSGGSVRLVSVLPNGSPVELEGEIPRLDSVSENGSRVVFSIGGEAFGTYIRENDARTVKIPNGEFWAASGDGSKIFFTAKASAGLTNDTALSTLGQHADNNLYKYDDTTGGLVDLTPNNGEAEVLGVPGVSNDGSYVYFVAEGVFAAGATNGKPNLYVWHEGMTSFVATLEAGDTSDAPDWLKQSNTFVKRTSEVTPDGTHLVFMSMLSLTGYDNTDAKTGQRDYEQFLYDATTGRLVCVSCNPSGARPIGSSYIVDTRAGTGSSSGNIFHRVVSPDGERVLFDSYDALVPQDTNGREDVYEYAGGAVHLISTGTSSEESFIVEVSVSGNDVFFVSGQQLVGQDIDSAVDLYDARVGGGFAAPSPAVVCAGETCRGATAGAPALSIPASAVFSGQGNLVAAFVPVVSAPKAKKPKPKARHRRRKKKGRGGRSAHGARGGHSTGKRG
jgi:hypothetical protein